MTPVAVVLAVCFFLIVFSQFGGRIRATNAISWWLLALFLVVAVADPSVYGPFVSLLGVRLVSNFVLAAVVLFLIYQLLELNAITTHDRRRTRAALSRLAAREFCAKRGGAPRAEGAAALKALVVVPCYNEAAALPAMIGRLRQLVQEAPFPLDYCLVDDASTDASDAIMASLAPLNHARHLVNLGVSGGLMTGFAIAAALGADYVVQCDGDGQHPVDEIPRLVAAAEREKADLVVGSRFVSAEGRAVNRESTTGARVLGSKLLVLALRLLFPGTRATDPTSGFRAYSRRAMQLLLRVMPDEFPEPETMALVRTALLKTCEIPVVMVPRTTGQSSLAGIKSLIFMAKVSTALLGLRLRSLVIRRSA